MMASKWSDENCRTQTPPIGEEKKCAICLTTNFEDRSKPDGCEHEFCFVCLCEWSKMKLSCPLCKCDFNFIRHNFAENGKFDRYDLERPMTAGERRRRLFESMSLEQQELQRTVRSLSVAISTMPESEEIRARFPIEGRQLLSANNPNNAQGQEADHESTEAPTTSALPNDIEDLVIFSQQLTSGTINDLADGSTLLAKNIRSFRRYNALIQQSATMSRSEFLMAPNFRRLVYERNLYAQQLTQQQTNGRDRCIHAGFFQKNDVAINRLIPFMRRDLRVLLGYDALAHEIIEKIIYWLRKYGLQELECIPMKNELSTKTGVAGHTEQFIHELRNFARTPFEEEEYFSRVVYRRQGSELQSVDSIVAQSTNINSSIIEITADDSGSAGSSGATTNPLDNELQVVAESSSLRENRRKKAIRDKQIAQFMRSFGFEQMISQVDLQRHQSLSDNFYTAFPWARTIPIDPIDYVNAVNLPPSAIEQQTPSSPSSINSDDVSTNRLRQRDRPQRRIGTRPAATLRKKSKRVKNQQNQLAQPNLSEEIRRANKPSTSSYGIHSDDETDSIDDCAIESRNNSKRMHQRSKISNRRCPSASFDKHRIIHRQYPTDEVVDDSDDTTEPYYNSDSAIEPDHLTELIAMGLVNNRHEQIDMRTALETIADDDATMIGSNNVEMLHSPFARVNCGTNQSNSPMEIDNINDTGKQLTNAKPYQRIILDIPKSLRRIEEVTLSDDDSDDADAIIFQTAIKASLKDNTLNNDSDIEVMCEMPPRHFRTPEVVDLSNENDKEIIDLKSHVLPPQLTIIPVPDNDDDNCAEIDSEGVQFSHEIATSNADCVNENVDKNILDNEEEQPRTNQQTEGSSTIAGDENESNSKMAPESNMLQSPSAHNSRYQKYTKNRRKRCSSPRALSDSPPLKKAKVQKGRSRSYDATTSASMNRNEICIRRRTKSGCVATK